ncbi:MAG: glutamate--tRNA ligase [Candidatus Shikimatogenerans bostrichidophilus]|nr:MAG: glutamate--tRNA ligase [Candidatus Shikimatogenerans bostrichidophilus]
MKKKIRVRFAPSPTGPLHIGGLRTAFYNYIYAKKYNGDFYLRIDDTDIKRNRKEYIKYILKALKWCKIKYNKGYNINKNRKYIQSKRYDIYKRYLNYLIKNKYAYYAFETKKELNEYRKNKNFIYNFLTRHKLNNSLNKNNKYIKKYIKNKKFVIRLVIPSNINIIYKDEVFGNIEINTKEIDDKIIYRSNNKPTYHLASAVDDHLMKITHIIRGKEWLSTTPIYIILYKYFNWTIPKFIHLPLLLNNKGKISKRFNYNNLPIYPINYKNLVTNNSYKSNGFFRNVFIYILALLGRSDLSEYKILNLKKIIKLFSLKKINKSDIKINYKLFCSINRNYILYGNSKNINYKLYLFLKKKNNNNIKKKIIYKIINLTKNRISLINDIWNVSFYFFINPIKYNIPKDIIKYINTNYKDIIKFIKNNIIFFFKKKNIKYNNINNYIKNINNINLLKIIRLSIVGELVGINLIDIIYILNKINKKIIIKRLKNFKKFIYQYKNF